MGKLKPIEKLAEDCNKFDIVRIQLNKDNSYVGHVFNIEKSGEVSFSHKGPYEATIDYSNKLMSNGIFSSRESFKSKSKKYKPKGYEILRRAKKK